MNEYLEETEAATPEATPEKDLTAAPETLEGQDTGTEKPGQADGTEKVVETEKTPEEVQADAEKPGFNPDEEVEIELNGKKFLKKQGEILELLEKNQGFAEKEQKLAQLEKQLNRDYTHKTQEIAGFRKSLQTNFGTIPDAGELQALGKVYKAYQTDPRAKAAIDQILGGSAPAAQGAEGDALNQAMEKIAELEQKLNGFTTSIEERESHEKQSKAKASWDKWEAEQGKAGIKITEEIDTEMGYLIPAIRARNPDWDDTRILNKAYALATHDQADRKAVKKVLLTVDEAKKKGVLKITPKAPAKSGKDQSYAEMLTE